MFNSNKVAIVKSKSIWGHWLTLAGITVPIEPQNQGYGVGVRVARSRGNEPKVGVGNDHAALTPTKEHLLEFVASLAYVIENLLLLHN